MVDVTNDPDRLVQPLRRTGSAGQFEPCSWEEALSDIAARLDDIRERHGPEVIAVQSGNPAYHSMAALMRSEEHTSELQSLMRISYAVFCLKQKTQQQTHKHT